MTSGKKRATPQHILLGAVSSVALLFGAGSAGAVVPNHHVTPGPVSINPTTGLPIPGSQFANSPDILSRGVNGIGQQLILVPTGGLSLCSGSLINPRTVITAAHCVYNFPAHAYGSDTGTQNIPYAFGFNEANRTQCGRNATTGLFNPCYPGADPTRPGPYEQWRDDPNHRTNVANNIYNVNQVWYDPSSAPPDGEFANADIALVTLDTHAKGIPTWTLLFSPLTSPAHATITGYGATGVGLSGLGSNTGIDYRRRAAENMIDALMSIHDFVSAPAIGGPTDTSFIDHQHAIYWMDFDDPDFSTNPPPNFFNNTAPPGERDNGYYDFNGLGGPGGTALPLEASTAGGDSGGPLIVDRKFDRPVIAGVLTGSFSFNGGISTYGQFNVYPPLFLFWEEIVQNNPYVYASAKAGSGDWFDPTHWVQDMDPNYAIIGANGKLVNSVPDTHQGGADGPVAKFGTICFLNTNCTNITGPGNAQGNGIPVITPGGPGSTNFVPNNVEPVNSADPEVHRKARYYDVTLKRFGETTLSRAATIDKLTIDGPSKLDIRRGGTLTVLSDFTQGIGWTHVDGVLRAGESLVAAGLLTGSGRIDPTFLTVARALVTPGQPGQVSTLTIQGDVILASGAVYLVDVSRSGADKLVVTGDADNPGILSLGGTAVFNKVGAAPRHGDSFVIATATGGVENSFDQVESFQGVLRPELIYGPNSVTALLRAGKLADVLKDAGATEMAFANALDVLRDSSYGDLYDLYGAVDLMDGAALAQTLRGLAPAIAGETVSLQARQSRVMLNAAADRLSALGTPMLDGLSVVGSPQAVAVLNSGDGAFDGSVLQLGLAQGLLPTRQALAVLPQGVTGFVSGGFIANGSGYGDNRTAEGQRSWHLGMGLEMAMTDALTIGTAFSYARGSSSPGSALDRTDSRTTQAAFYGSYRLGGGAYVAGLAAAETSRADLARQTSAGDVMFALNGAASSSRYQLQAEAGVNIEVARGLTLTPRAALAYSSYELDGYREHGGETALRISDLKVRRLESRVGAKFAGSTSVAKGWSLVPQIQADWVRNLSGSNHGLTVRFASAGDYAFTLPLNGGDSSWGEVRGGLRLVSERIELGAGVESNLGRSEFQDNRAIADLTLRF